MLNNLLSTDAAGGLSGPLEPSYDKLIPIIVGVIFAIIIVVAIVAMVVGARRKNENKSTQDSESIDNLTAEEQELIRKHREQSKEENNEKE